MKIFIQNNKRIDISFLNQIIEEYSKFGASFKSVAKLFDISSYTVGKIIKKYSNVKTSSENKRRYYVDENFFSKIDTPEKAIFLGLALTDGCNLSNCNSFSISLQPQDRDILEKFSSLFQPSKPLSVSRKGTRQEMVSLSIESKKICEDLEKWGIPPRKTFQTKWPDWLPDHLIRPFLQGCWEGDGSFKSGVSITGSEDFILGVEKFLLDVLNISCFIYTRHPERKNNIRTLFIRKKFDQKKFCEWLYKDSPLFMNRKYNDAILVMNYNGNPKHPRNPDGTLLSREQQKERTRLKAIEGSRRQRESKKLKEII